MSAVCVLCASECLLNSSFSALSLLSSSRMSSAPPRPDPRFLFIPAFESLPSSSVSAPSGTAPSEVWTRLKCSFRFSCREKPLPVWRLQFRCGQLSCFRGPWSLVSSNQAKVRPSGTHSMLPMDLTFMSKETSAVCEAR